MSKELNMQKFKIRKTTADAEVVKITADNKNILFYYYIII